MEKKMTFTGNGIGCSETDAEKYYIDCDGAFFGALGKDGRFHRWFELAPDRVKFFTDREVAEKRAAVCSRITGLKCTVCRWEAW